jgi:hypothetical protein
VSDESTLKDIQRVTARMSVTGIDDPGRITDEGAGHSGLRLCIEPQLIDGSDSFLQLELDGNSYSAFFVQRLKLPQHYCT